MLLGKSKDWKDRSVSDQGAPARGPLATTAVCMNTGVGGPEPDLSCYGMWRSHSPHKGAQPRRLARGRQGGSSHCRGTDRRILLCGRTSRVLGEPRGSQGTSRVERARSSPGKVPRGTLARRARQLWPLPAVADGEARRPAGRLRSETPPAGRVPDGKHWVGRVNPPLFSLAGPEPVRSGRVGIGALATRPDRVARSAGPSDHRPGLLGASPG